MRQRRLEKGSTSWCTVFSYWHPLELQVGLWPTELRGPTMTPSPVCVEYTPKFAPPERLTKHSR